jgi:hypothetical protein
MAASGGRVLEAEHRSSAWEEVVRRDKEEFDGFTALSGMHPVAEFEDTGEPYRASEKPKKATREPQTLQESLCRHGLYGATCPRCRYGSRAAGAY